ncbi:hypothetical protein V6N12_068052 [Hibiscus sabdariffa]|uniref:Uncharacterized protein n=1 Tax=Hibiscus sabdariffa TaxID=183260 RepID=A0ABR2FNY9_9ROSI
MAVAQNYHTEQAWKWHRLHYYQPALHVADGQATPVAVTHGDEALEDHHLAEKRRHVASELHPNNPFQGRSVDNPNPKQSDMQQHHLRNETTEKTLVPHAISINHRRYENPSR